MRGGKGRGSYLGDCEVAFAIASVSKSFIVMVPNNPTDCVSRAGPAPVELARIGPPPEHSMSVDAPAQQSGGVVYSKGEVKRAWLSDLLLVIEMHQRGATFDDDGMPFNAAGGG